MENKTTSVRIDEVVIPRGRRPLRGVSNLAGSIGSCGLLQPITVTSDFILVLGYHRLEACRSLGWVTIPAHILDGDVLDLELAEIDENLIRNDLNVIEQGEHFVRREAIMVLRGQRAVSGTTLANTRGGETVSPPRTTADLAAEMGMGERSLQHRKQIATRIVPEVRDMIRDLPVATHTRDLLELSRAPVADQPAIAAALVSGEVETVREARQLVREDKRATRDADMGAPSLASATGPFDLIYADPPWKYDHSKTDNRAIENQYPTMDLSAICCLPVPDIASSDCVLFLWATSPKLAEAMEVITAWGFVYRTCAVWVKDKIGLGYYFRQQHELLLVAVRGAPGTPEPTNRLSSVIEAPRTQHSAKPPEVYDMLTAMYPRARKVELFARTSRDGWAGWGFEAPSA